MSEQNGNKGNEIKKDNTSEIKPLEESAVKGNEEDKAQHKVKTVNWKNSFVSIIIDQAISLGISVVALFIIDAIMRAFGFYIENKEGMFIIFFVIVNVIYNTVMHGSKSSSTFGEKVAHLKVTK